MAALGTTLRKFVASDNGIEMRVVLHGFIDENGNMHITNELISTDPYITGAK